MTMKPDPTPLQTEAPPRLLAKMQSLVDAGWFRSLERSPISTPCDVLLTLIAKTRCRTSFVRTLNETS